MASQPVSGREDIISLEVYSYVRGYHVYQDIWNPRIGEALPLEREPDNSEDKFAVAIVRRSRVVGHLLQSGASSISLSKKRCQQGTSGSHRHEGQSWCWLRAGDPMQVSFLRIEVLY